MKADAGIGSAFNEIGRENDERSELNADADCKMDSYVLRFRVYWNFKVVAIFNSYMGRWVRLTLVVV